HRALRRTPGLLPLRGHGERPLHPAFDHRRDHVRDHEPLRPGVRRHVRGARQGGAEATRGARRQQEGILSTSVPPIAGPAAVGAVQDRRFRALVWVRVVLVVNAAVLNMYRFGNFDHPWLGMGIVGAMAVWTAAMSWAYAA